MDMAVQGKPSPVDTARGVKTGGAQAGGTSGLPGLAHISQTKPRVQGRQLGRPGRASGSAWQVWFWMAMVRTGTWRASSGDLEGKQ